MIQANLSIELPPLIGRNIKDICDCEYADKAINHCAHFVSHIMNYTFGLTCKQMTGKGTGLGANIRVHEVFSRCVSVGEWADKPDGKCLAFVTASSHVNLAGKIMLNVPAKHIGICLGNKIYHYSNSKDKVVCVTPEVFAKHYQGKDIQVYYGTFPLIS